MRILLLVPFIFIACSTQTQQSESLATGKKIRLLIDTDANNELDDQHALAYAIYNQDVFDIEGITVNNTMWGDGIEGHYDEAMRILQLSNAVKDIPLHKGAKGSYAEIAPHVHDPGHDGEDAVNFIIRQAMKEDEAGRELVLLPIGKLTNIALALKKAPEIKDKVRVVWLGSNYPDEGEYNLENDTTSVNPVIASGVPFEMVVVRYSDTTGTGFVKISKDEILAKMPGLGVTAKEPVTGRHGGEFKTFGDYSINLFENAKMDGTPPSRSLFDMAAVAILKNPTWAQKVLVPAPRLNGNRWTDAGSEEVKIGVWQNFNRDAIIDDMFKSLAKGKSDN